MHKGQSAAEQFYTRSGSFSTRPSRTGSNLLGWEEAESLSGEQRISAMNARVVQIQKRLSEIKTIILTESAPDNLLEERKRLSNEQSALCDEISREKGGSLGPISPSALLRAIHARLSPRSFQKIVDEANSRQSDAHLNASSSPSPAQQLKQRMLAEHKELTSSIDSVKAQQRAVAASNYKRLRSLRHEQISLGKRLDELNRKLSCLRCVKNESLDAHAPRSLESLIADITKEHVGVTLWKIIVQDARMLDAEDTVVDFSEGNSPSI